MGQAQIYSITMVSVTTEVSNRAGLKGVDYLSTKGSNVQRQLAAQAFSRARVRVVRSQTSLGPQYWMAPG